MSNNAMKKWGRVGVALLLLSSSYALAKGPKGHGGPMMGGPGGEKHMQRMLDNLELTDEQKTKVEELKKAMKDGAKKSRDDQKAKMDAFQAAMADPTKTDDDLKKVHDEMLASRNAMMTAHFNTMLQIRALLTDEQRKKFAEMHGDMSAGKKGKKGKKRKDK